MWKSIFAAAAGAAAMALMAVGPDDAVTASLRAAQQPPPSSAPSGQSAPSPMADMMKRHQQMMAEMKAAEEKLDQLVAQMNAATGDAKVAAMAQVVNELARQQKALREHMDQMPMMMMGGRGMMNR